MLRASLLLVALLHAAAHVSGAKVLVTGAGGRTGKLVFQKLKRDYAIMPLGLARSMKAVKALRKAGASDDEIIRADVTDKVALVSAMAGCDSVVLCTSAVPKIKFFTLLKVLFKKFVLRRKEPGRPEFTYPRGTPEEIDWLGAKLQIDAAKEAGVARFVFVSSMGGTQPGNFLNSIGRCEDGSGGDILLWKRKAERYLIASGMAYTIVHPGGLIDEPACKRQLIVGFDDQLLELKNRQVPRGDVARVCCAALFDTAAANKSFDLASKPVGEGAVTPNGSNMALFVSLMGRSCDYTVIVPDPPSSCQARDTKE